MRTQALRESGFTLLEAIVATVLLATAGLALLTWMNGALESLNRIEQQNRRTAAELNALEYLRNLNPLERPSGEINLGATTMRWNAQVRGEAVPNRNDFGDAGNFVVALFDTEITLSSQAFDTYSFTVSQFGYRRVRADVDVFGDPVGAPAAARTR
jgi:general secretion pathway protein I